MERGDGVQELEGASCLPLSRARQTYLTSVDSPHLQSPHTHPPHLTRTQGEKRVLFDAQKDGQKIAPKWVAPEDEQEPNESRRLWARLTRAIVAKDMDAATEAKSAVEDAQRDQRRRMEERGEVHVPRFFHLRDGRWVPKFS